MAVYQPPSGAPHILHLDDEIVVIAKPAGLLSVPGRGIEKADCVVSRVSAQIGEALSVHRLDMETSGAMVLARNKAAQARLSRQFEGRSVSKRYAAVVAGRVAGNVGEIALPLIADWPRRPRQKVCHETGKPSLTRWRVSARGDGVTYMELEPETGRSHQLRVHMAAIGHPILGDSLYAPRSVFAQAERLLLHAEWLALDHPSTGVRLEVDAPRPPEFDAAR